MTPFDKTFKNKLEHYQTEVSEDMWAKISAGLPKEKKKIYLVGPFTAALVVIALSVAVISIWLIQTGDTSAQKKHAPRQVAHVKLDEKNDSQASLQTSSQPHMDEKETSSSELALTSKKNQIPAGNNQLSAASSYQTKINNQSTINTASSDSEWQTPVDPIDQSLWREKINVSPIQNHLANQKLKTYRKIKFKSPSQTEKIAKACPFVFDVQNKSVEVYWSHDAVDKSLSPVNPSYAAYANMRNATERALYSFSVGARFGYNLSYRWNLHTGFHYGQINEKFEYTDPESNQIREIIIKDYIYQNGIKVDSIFTKDTIVVPGSKRLSINNSFRTFDIPVIGRYTLAANRKLSLSASVGIFLNLSFSQRGMILDGENGRPISMTTKEDERENVFKSQLGISGFASVSMAYHLTENLDFILEPNMRIQVESISNDAYPIRQSFNTFGLSTGLRYKF